MFARIFSPTSVFLFILCVGCLPTAAADEACGAGEGGTCDTVDHPICGEAARCWFHPNKRANPSSLYRRPGSGSAQAYKPDAPVKLSVCEPREEKKHGKYKVATWLFSRRTRSTRAPTLQVNLQLWSCLSDHMTESSECCCGPLAVDETTKVEVWQANPEGTYSSLIAGRDEGDCRATLPPPASGKSYQFTSLAPGSVGSLGGLGPGSIDFAPYGPPVLHFLATTGTHEPLLVEVPIVMDRNLKQQAFSGPDWRGTSMHRQQNTEQKNFRISSWSTNSKDTVKLNLDLFLQARPSPDHLEETLCPSWLYGLPESFFTEPIAVCAPSLLDFFPL